MGPGLQAKFCNFPIGCLSKGVDETDPDYPRTLEIDLAAEIKATQASPDSFDVYWL